MRLEDKELEGPDLEREQRLEGFEDATHEHDKELPEHAGPEVVDAELAHRSRLFDALHAVLAGENLSIPMLYLPQRESQALEALQAAVSGRDRSMGNFVFAEDRGSLLEQALSVLQQNLTHGDRATLASLHAKYTQLTEHVAELRDHLVDLEDAQDDLIEQKLHREETASGDAPDPTDEQAESVTGFIASALSALATVAVPEAEQPFRSTLVGPDLSETTKPASMLDGPEPTVTRPATSLTGADLPAPVPHASALDAPGPEVSKPEHVSALDGPERELEEKRSSLYPEGMSAPIVPEQPRVADHQPVGMYADGTRAEGADGRRAEDGRGPAPPSSAAELKQAQQAAPKAARDSPRQLEPIEASPDNTPSKPAARRGLSVRSSEKPGNKP